VGLKTSDEDQIGCYRNHSDIRKLAFTHPLIIFIFSTGFADQRSKPLNSPVGALCQQYLLALIGMAIIKTFEILQFATTLRKLCVWRVCLFSTASVARRLTKIFPHYHNYPPLNS
jgi:hypothetical protein